MKKMSMYNRHAILVMLSMVKPSPFPQVREN